MSTWYIPRITCTVGQQHPDGENAQWLCTGQQIHKSKWQNQLVQKRWDWGNTTEIKTCDSDSFLRQYWYCECQRTNNTTFLLNLVWCISPWSAAMAHQAMATSRGELGCCFLLSSTRIKQNLNYFPRVCLTNSKFTPSLEKSLGTQDSCVCVVTEVAKTWYFSFNWSDVLGTLQMLFDPHLDLEGLHEDNQFSKKFSSNPPDVSD